MQHRYRVMKNGRADYVAEVCVPLADDADHWKRVKHCTTRWGAIWACKKAARQFEERRTNNPVWAATLPLTEAQMQEKLENDNAAFNS